jgi:mono/diheme cytochrome c family protein
MAAAPKPVVATSDSTLEGGGNATQGQTIFYAGGCASCHATPGQEDPLRLGGGLELKSPFGSFFAPNISPHPDDGIGRWKVADLVNAMQAGVSPRGEHYFPAFPYTTYTHAKSEDIGDLMAFLRTLPAVPGKAPPHSIGFPFNIRAALGVWKLFYLDHKPVTEDATRSPEWNRGHYLTEALGHCVECHSGRNLIGGITTAYRYAGGVDLEGRGWVPNITPAGINGYSKQDVENLLATGETPDGDSVGGSMTAVVRNTSKLPQEDRAAIAEFIKSLPSRESPPKPPKKD